MSMDRLRRILAGGTLVLLGTVVAGSGCRSMHNEVPPGPKYSTTGEPSSSGFNSQPHPYNALSSPYATNPATAGAAQPGMSGTPGIGATAPGPATDGLPPVMGSSVNGSSYGTPAPSSPGMGTPTLNSYGPPGTSGGAGR
jgi:hypothetical protein